MVTKKQLKAQPEAASAVEQRKREHIEVSLKKAVEYSSTNLFEEVVLLHNAVPELSREQVDTSTKFLGHKFSAPMMITGMIGGAKEAERINKNIARSCQAVGIGMGLGSMKAMIVEPSLTYTYQVRDVAPDIFLAGNIGANDLVHFPPKVLMKALKDVGANVLAVHLNPAQELVQKEGKADFTNVMQLIDDYSKEIPIYVKEVGQGISGDVAKRLSKTKILAIDVAGAGGTNWIDIEYIRRGIENGPLAHWGIPTALALIQSRRETNLPLVATGGIRSAEEIVKAVVLGADVCAFGLPMLRNANIDHKQATEHLNGLIREIGDWMFLLGVSSIKDLKRIKPLTFGKLRELSQQ